MNKYLLQQFNTTYNTTNRFVSFNDAVRHLSEEHAREKANGSTHSIYELVSHLAFWNERYLQKIRNEKSPAAINSNEDTFNLNSSLSWQELLLKAEQVFEQWQTEIASLKLLEARDEKNDWPNIIGHIITHNAYHIGQIVILRKLQGSWNPDQGVK